MTKKRRGKKWRPKITKKLLRRETLKVLAANLVAAARAAEPPPPRFVPIGSRLRVRRPAPRKPRPEQGLYHSPDDFSRTKLTVDNGPIDAVLNASIWRAAVRWRPNPPPIVILPDDYPRRWEQA